MRTARAASGGLLLPAARKRLDRNVATPLCVQREVAVAIAGGGSPSETHTLGVGLRLALDETVAGLRPEQDVLVLIVEDVVALVGGHRLHGMTVVLAVAYDGHEQRLARPAGLDQEVLLEQHVVSQSP